jgi:AAA+ ATPase superfamily predicted ATPase
MILLRFIVAQYCDITKAEMMNPFKFGSVVDGEYFTDREPEIRELVSDIKSGQNVILISQRRMGKTSLVSGAIKKAGFPSVQLDLEIITDELDLANTYTKKLLSLSSMEKLKQYLKGFKFQPVITFNPATGEMEASFDMSSSESSSTVLLDSFELAETIAKDRRKRIVVMLDEFQEVRRISPMLERKMRGVFQNHQNVSYIFIGSQESMIRDIFQQKKSPFYKFGRQMTLMLIPENYMLAFVKERFSSIGIKIGSQIESIMKITGYHPYYTQQLCYEIYLVVQEASGNNVEPEDVSNAVEKIITQHNADYKSWWNLLTNVERKIIIGISAGMTEPSSQAFIQKYGIRSTSSAVTAVNRLIQKGYLVRDAKTSKVFIEDPFWGQWVRKIRK